MSGQSSGSQNRTQNPFGLTGETMSMASLSHEMANMRKDQQRLMEQMRAFVSNQTENAASSLSTAPSNIAFGPRDGPRAPPRARKHQVARIRRNWRRLLQEKMGDARKKPYEYDWPSSLSSWPVRIVRGRPGAPDRRVRLLRLNYHRSYKHEDNQGQLRPLFDHLLTHRNQNGVPADMTLEELIGLMSNTYTYFRRQYNLRSSSAGRQRVAREKARSQLHARKRAKRTGRSTTGGFTEYARFADGTELRRIAANRVEINKRRHEMRADIEFGFQTLVHSPEITESEPTIDGLFRTVTRPLSLPWRSRRLENMIHELDTHVSRVRPYEARPSLAFFRLSSKFTLPSSVRRWMVSSEWAEEYPETCVNVSYNAGPFGVENQHRKGFAVADSASEWGSPIPLDERAGGFGEGEGEDDGTDYFSLRGRAPRSSGGDEPGEDEEVGGGDQYGDVFDDEYGDDE
ncbi:hypothetical protein A4X13_0g9063, partial [Tilletia indica]